VVPIPVEASKWVKTLLDFPIIICYMTLRTQLSPMKKLLLLPLVALVFVANSCRTAAPVDPMTMKPSDRCLPGDSSGYSGK
jgi:hypothetical protein